MTYTESNYENAYLEYFHHFLDYDHVYAPDLSRDYHEPLYLDELHDSLQRINPQIPYVAIKEAIYKLRNVKGSTLVLQNKQFMDYLQNGITVNYFHKNEQCSALVQLIDYENIHNNSFIVANQWTVTDRSTKRPDIIVFLNGLPIVVIELKSPSREDTSASEAYLQLRNYIQEIPSLFVYNAFLIMSDLAISKAGTITSGEDRFMEWKTVDGSYEETKFANFETLLEGMFSKERLLDIIRSFICFSGDTKILAAYHQYYAVKKAVESTKKATQTDGKAGVFWHTQGSGKSLSMVFYARLLVEALGSPTIVVVTDRNDLDNQLYGQFANCADFLRQSPQQAESRSNLKELLDGREAYGIVFTTMQKFEEVNSALSQRRNLVVMADEAHRSHYGLGERVDAVSGRVSVGTARIIRDNLPNATFIGFTGTPISSEDRSTTEVFGNYIDVYDMTQAVEDGATKPVYYESRVIHLKLDDSILRQIDREYDHMALQADPYAIEKSKQELGQMESLLGAEETITALCEDVVQHYEDNRQHYLTGKAMIVAYSRAIALKIYHKILSIRPHWKEKIGLVMTESNKDPEEWRAYIGNKKQRDEMGRRFKDNEDPFKIAIVVDMWLTGFDVPSLATMYVYKPMKGHNLMQAIARVNRVYKEKEGGLIVDYVGIASALKEAMSDYTNRDKSNYGDMDIAKTALPKFVEKLEVCRDLMYGYDYSAFLDKDASDLDRSRSISGGVNFLSEIEKPVAQAEEGFTAAYLKIADEETYSHLSLVEQNKKDLFLKEALLLHKALALCSSLLDAEQRYEAAYFEAVRTVLNRIANNTSKISLKEINEQINSLLKESIKSEGVINLFSDIDTEFSLFDPNFLEELSRIKEKNLAVELLKKLISEQVTNYRRTNLVKSEKFSEKMNRLMRTYLNGMITNEEVIEELMRMAQEMASGKEEETALGLSEEEMAFYDALTYSDVIKDFYENEELVAMTRDLTDQLRKSRTIDWHKKESARAGMRRLIKRLLRKYDYPPEGHEQVMSTVIKQCEVWAEN